MLVQWHKTVCVVAVCALFGTVLDASAQVNTNNTPIHSVPLGSRLLTVPALEPGQKAWASIYDQAGRAIAGASLLINGVPHDADGMGQVGFDVPKDNHVSLCLRTEQGKSIEKYEYTLTPGGYLTTQTDVAAAMDQLEGAVESHETGPMIAYAPAVIETSQPFVIIGKNLSGTPEADRIVLDGYDTDVFAGSTISLLSTAPKRISLGPLRELYVTARGESSNLMEVDICRVDFSLLPASAEEPECAILRVVGSNVPALVQLQVDNSAPDSVSLRFGDRILGTRSSFITPGGDNNRIVLGLKRASGQKFDVDTHLCSDAPWCAVEDRTVFGDCRFKEIVADLNKAEIVRLRRRLIALDERMVDARARRSAQLAAGGILPGELDKLNAEMRTLSTRQARISAMISSRRAVFSSLGGTDLQYREALEDASGGTTFALEKQLAPVVTAALLASTNASNAMMHPNAGGNELSPEMNGSSEDLEAQKAQLAKSMAALSRAWKRFPSKPAPAGRLAAPPEPYIPDLAQVFGGAPPSSYMQYSRLHNPPPPAILHRLRANHNNATASLVQRKSGTHKKSSKRKHNSSR
jgi:hypothetical protein